MKFSLSEFEEWLRARGYDRMMGEENFRQFLSLGLASLLFQNSNLLIAFIFNKLGVEMERIEPRIRFAVGKKVKKIVATHDELEIELS
ncbi:MAG: hypothetical protein ABWW66_03480 [Archaeoglobaceae archaeon]